MKFLRRSARNRREIHLCNSMVKIKNKTLIVLFCIFLLTSVVYFCHTPRICIVAEVDLHREFILTTSPLDSRELGFARRGLVLVREIDPTQHYELFEHIEVHWMKSSKFAGITVYKNDGDIIIILDESLKIKNENNPWEFLRLGVIYSHELSHALNGTKDPHTEEITDAKIWRLIRDNKELTKRVSEWKP